MGRRGRYSPEVRDRAVRMVFEQEPHHESQWAAIGSISTKIGCTAETLRKWVRQAEREQGQRAVSLITLMAPPIAALKAPP
ncbi:MAG: transposase, partial [Thermoanaerobaculia bacterium]|nr:transposase [Thermoanaerobaculia bacterium]